MIPRVIHRVWCGSSQRPDIYEEYWRAWQRQLPDYEFVTWEDADAARVPLAKESFIRGCSPVQKADILRYAILHSEGGVYMDCDMMPLTWRDWGVEDGLLTCNESEADDIRSIGFIAAPREDATFARALERISRTSLGSRPINEETGPVLFRQCIEGETQLPTEAFYPYHYDEPFSLVFERSLTQTYGIHVWGMSWLTPPALAAKARNWMFAGDIAAAESLALPIQDQPQAGEIVQHVARVRTARATFVDQLSAPAFAAAVRQQQLCGQALPAALNREAPNATPSFFDAAWHLLKSRPGSAVWQIGAADGIVADLLRPLLVNFDPVGVLVEPNPWLYDQLRRNYRNNRHLTLLNVAIGAQAAKSQLRAVNPAVVSDRGLPHWALGLSTFQPTSNALGGKTVTPDMRERLMSATELIDVDVITFGDVLSEAGGQKPDIVVIDVEGMDAELVVALFTVPLYPRIVMFEQSCLSTEEVASLRQRLPDNYFWADLGEDVVLYRRDFLDELTREQFVEEGRTKLLARWRPDLLLPGYFPR